MSLTNLICITDYVVECIGAGGAILLSHLKEFQSGADTMVPSEIQLRTFAYRATKPLIKMFNETRKKHWNIHVHTCTHFYSGIKR